MVMSIPFFLGATHKPYFFLFEILVYGTLILGFIHLWKQKTSIEIPFKPLVLLLFLSALFSIPINAKEYYYEFWATPAKEIWFQWLSGNEKFPLFHLRALSNTLSGMLIFILTTNLFSKNTPADFQRILKGVLLMAVIICLTGILFLFNIIPSGQSTYLSLSLAGLHEGAISAFAFNRQYLAQYLLILFPFLFYFLYLGRKKILWLLLSLLVLGLFIFSLSASMQRSAFLILFLEIFILIVFYTKFISTQKKRTIFLILIPLLFLAGMILIDFLFLNKRFLLRVLYLGFSDPDQRRYNLWATAWHMFTFSPLLGVGLGKYFEFFPEFFKNTLVSWKTFGFVRGEPHSFYLQTLSEQGAIGFLLLLSLVAIVIYKMIKKTKEEPSNEKKMLILVLMISLVSWLLLGFFHNVSYVRSLGVLFWILLGWSISLITPRVILTKNKTNTKIFFIGLLILTAALGYQIKLVVDRPITPHFQTGLFEKETLPSGGQYRWTGRRAIVITDVHGGKINLSISAPLPEVAENPQYVRLWIGGKVHKVILRDNGWYKITIPAEKSFAEKMLLKIETNYTFNPKKAKLSEDNRDLGIMIRDP